MSKKFANILLDLDQTLISAEPCEEFKFNNKENKEKSKKFNFYNMDSYYIIFERPGLQEFLDFLFDNFNVSIWTAASKDYALFVIDKIILNPDNDKYKLKKRKLDYIFFSYHCNVSKRIYNNTKDLNMLWDIYKLTGYKNYNTVILDDYDEVYKCQPDNCIRAIPFEYNQKDSENDNFLLKIIPKLKDMLKNIQLKKGKPASIVNI
jgi:TFIIF-interacting CTD phosphatase-like protein